MSITEAIRYGAFELKRVYNKNLGIAVAVSIGIHLLLVALYFFSVKISEAGNDGPTAPISRVKLTNLAPPPAEDVPPPPPPPMIPPELMTNTGGSGGVAARAGKAVAIPDALVTPDMQDFAATTELAVARPEGGDGSGFGGNSEGFAIDLNEPVQVTEKEELPDIYEFKPVEKEATYDKGELRRLLKYPPIAERNGIEGKVTVRVLVGKEGRAVKSVIEKSSNSMFDQNAKDAVMAMTYTPAVQNGNPTSLWISFEVVFQLR